MPKQNDWDQLKITNLKYSNHTEKEYKLRLDRAIEAHKKFILDHPNGVMHGQRLFYASKMDDPDFLINRDKYKFLATTMLPIGCGYGAASYGNLPVGAIFCYTESAFYRVGFQRDYNSSAHIEQVGREDGCHTLFREKSF